MPQKIAVASANESPVKTAPKISRGRNLYFRDELKPYFVRMAALEEKTKVSVSRQVAAMIMACTKEMEEKLPNMRKFTLNGVEVIP